MEKNQYELCVEIIRRLYRAGVLQETLLIGSWCLPFYKYYFKNQEYHAAIRTRDIDFMLPNPAKIRVKANLPDLFKDLGFIQDIGGEAGYIRLANPDLIIEFLVPEKGRGSDKPYPLPQLGLNAQSLRFLSYLAENEISVKVESIPVRLPHPANFAFHKLMVAGRRSKKDKAEKDMEAGVYIFNALIDKGEASYLKKQFNDLHKNWQKTIIATLQGMNADKVLGILTTDR